MIRALLIGVGLLTSSIAWGQTIVYTPTNPAFGGNTFNYQWLQSSAQAQDKIKDPATVTRTGTGLESGTGSSNTLNNFAQSLQNQLLSQLTRNLLGSQFTEQGLKEGTFQFGDLQVIITNGIDGVNIQITDGKGGQTTITVPYF